MTFVQTLNSFFDFVDQIDKDVLFNWIIGFITLMYLWENYLSLRQHLVERRNKKIPKELENVTDQETFDKSRVYSIDKGVYNFIHGAYSQIEAYLIIYLGALPYVWNLSGEQLRSTGIEWLSSEIMQSILFIFYFMVFSQITSLPWSIYYTFVLEEKHGFNKQTFSFFVKDNIKKFIVSIILTAPIVALLIYIIRIGGDYFFIYAWLFTTFVALFLITIYADFIAPLFDKYEPLHDGELKTRIEELAKSLNFPLYKLYVLEGSKRSAHSNAYMYGFHKNKRIVLFDTLIEGYVSSIDRKELEAKKNDNVPSENNSSESPMKDVTNVVNSDETTKKDQDTKKTTKGCTTDEILAVLAHELGHWKLNHNVKNLVLNELNTLLYFLIFAVLMNRQVFYSAFGFDYEKPVLIGLIIIIQFIFAPYNELITFIMVCIGRRFEFQADHFAKCLDKSQHLKTSLIKLHKDNLSFPMSDWLYSTWHFSHPPLLERLRALDEEHEHDHDHHHHHKKAN